jgi:hypothetical protein
VSGGARCVPSASQKTRRSPARDKEEKERIEQKCVYIVSPDTNSSVAVPVPVPEVVAVGGGVVVGRGRKYLRGILPYPLVECGDNLSEALVAVVRLYFAARRYLLLSAQYALRVWL